ncbi:hypothetical protein [Streptomyces sp. CA-253872]|uniref:hypothetical protein n=1 Tax=Streptomyces sp. CA-253872 TaxID=3240067 RepID=UPI003D8A6BF1
MKALLRALDDPEHVERPRGFDTNAEAYRARLLAERLGSAFGTSCAADLDEQDSSAFGRVTVPAAATRAGERIVLCLSAFGRLALVCADNPGAYCGTEDARRSGALDPADLRAVAGVLGGLGYVVVPEELVEEAYGGQVRCLSERPTWRDRYFGTF